MMRRLLVILGTLALTAAGVAGAPEAEAATRIISLEFSGEISLWSQVSCDSTGARCTPTGGAQPKPMWAPVSPNPACSPICPRPQFNVTSWILGPAGGAGGGVPCTAVTTSGVRPCHFHAAGQFHAGGGAGPLQGPYCYSTLQGPVDAVVTIDGVDTVVGGAPAAQFHAWPTLLWSVDTDGVLGVPDGGVASMTITKAHGNCGLDAPDFAPMSRADVKGGVTWAQAL